MQRWRSERSAGCWDRTVRGHCGCPAADTRVAGEPGWAAALRQTAKMSAEAVQIVEIEEDANVFRLNEEGLAAVLARVPPDAKVAVVAVAGAFRTGKSFLLDLFLRYLRAGADVATTVRAGCELCECKCCPVLALTSCRVPRSQLCRLANTPANCLVRRTTGC